MIEILLANQGIALIQLIIPLVVILFVGIIKSKLLNYFGTRNKDMEYKEYRTLNRVFNFALIALAIIITGNSLFGTYGPRLTLDPPRYTMQEQSPGEIKNIAPEIPTLEKRIESFRDNADQNKDLVPHK